MSCTEMSITFSYAEEEQKVRDTLKDAIGPNVAISTAEEWHGRVHVKIVSSAFDGKSDAEKQEMIWNELQNRLGPEAQAVSLVLAYGLGQLPTDKSCGLVSRCCPSPSAP